MADMIGASTNVTGIPFKWNTVDLLDYRSVNWETVHTARYFFYQRFVYEYPGAITNVRQRLMVIPTETYGDQILCSHDIDVLPGCDDSRHSQDRFGNHVYECSLAVVDQTLCFEIVTTLERRFDAQPIRSTRAQAQLFAQPTRLTQTNAALHAIAHDMRRLYPSPDDRAAAISAWVSENMQYQYGVTHVGTTAAQAFTLGSGLCQDYAHIMIAVCRAADIPARYVSGHMLGEGGSHAWVEVFIPHQDGGCIALAFDPTNKRQPHGGYITVSVGRDYDDVSPTRGTFTAPYSGCLTCSKKAGLTFIE